MAPTLLDLQTYLKNKTVCLLGNARSILKTPKNIDRYEIIGRINHGLPKGKEQYIGTRTDVLFTSTNISDSEIVQFDAKYVVWITKSKKYTTEGFRKNAIQNPPEDWQDVKKYYPDDKIPSTGCIVINFLLKHIQFKSLILIGFDFMKTGTHYNNSLVQSWHPPEIEEQVIKHLIMNRSNVKIMMEPTNE